MKLNVKNRLIKKLFPLLSFLLIFCQNFSENRPMNTIESLSTRERAEMSVEVTKVTSEKMKGKLNVEEKTISLDFSEIEERVSKNRMRIREEDYGIFFVEDINLLPTYSTNGMGVSSNNKKGMKYNYKIDESNGKKKIKINYTEKPETFYMVVIDKRSGAIAKVFNISEFEVENNQPPNGNVKGIAYSFDNTPCVLEDFGNENSLKNLNCKRDIAVSQSAASTAETSNGDFPAIAVGGEWRERTGTYTLKKENLIHDFYIGETKISVPIYLSDLKMSGNGNKWGYSRTLEDAGKGRVYGDTDNAAKRTELSVSVKLNMEIEIEIGNLKKLRKDPSEQIKFIDREKNGDKITFIQANYSNPALYALPKSEDHFAESNYPDIVVNKVIMINNIDLNFKKGYKASDTNIIFNQNGTMGDGEHQLEVEKSGIYANDFFMTGLSSSGEIKVRANSFEGNPLVTQPYVVGDTGRATAQEFTIPANNVNNSNATISLGYGENGVVTLNLKDWDENYNSEYTFYVIHKEESGLIRRRNTVTIRTLGELGDPPLPPEFEIRLPDSLDFGTIMKGITIDPAKEIIQILGVNASNVNLSLSSTEVELSNGSNSKIEATISLSELQTGENLKSYTLTGVIADSSEAESGEHTGKINLTVGLSQRTKVNKR